MGKHIFTKLVHLENKSDGVHKEMGTVGLLGGKVSENCFSRALKPGRTQTHSLELSGSVFRAPPSLDKFVSHEKRPSSFLIKRLKVHC